MKLDASKEQLQAVRKQTEASECSQQSLEARVAELTVQLDASKSRCTQLVQEKDLLIKSLDSVRAEKNALDKNRLEINAMVSWRLERCGSAEHNFPSLGRTGLRGRGAALALRRAQQGTHGGKAQGGG